jgi:hypothetical protein
VFTAQASYDAEGLEVVKKFGVYVGLYSNDHGGFGYCFSNDPLAKFTVVQDQMLYRGSHWLTLRGMVQVDGGYLISFESNTAYQNDWRVYLGFIDESLQFASEIQNPPVTPTQTYEGTGICNPYLAETSQLLLLYYDGMPNVGVNVVLAYTSRS